MTEDERFFAAAYLQHLTQRNDPAYVATLAERMKRMDAGHKATLEQLHSLELGGGLESPALEAALREGGPSPHRPYGKATLKRIRKTARNANG